MTISEVWILDYGSGNVASVKNSFDRLGVRNKVSNDESDIRNMSHIVLPGVGAFKTSMEKIMANIPIETVIAEVIKGKPMLGICVGMQVLAENGFEYGIHPGLNLITGTEVVELPGHVSKPHVGWNSLEITGSHSILNGIESGSDFYFVHSYYMKNVSSSELIAVSDYGLNFPAVVALDNLIGVQFHPEKSQINGDLLLRNFLEIVG